MTKQIRSHVTADGTKIIQRLYRFETGFSIWAPEHCCLFCKKCSNIVYDYTNGPYMFLCDIHHAKDEDDEKELEYTTELGPTGKCSDFEEDDLVERRNEEIEKKEKNLQVIRDNPALNAVLTKVRKDMQQYLDDCILYGSRIADYRYAERHGKVVEFKRVKIEERDICGEDD